MKKIYCIMCMFLPMVASADALDDKINRLTQEKLQKIAQLEECQKNTKGLKIAGITTLGVSAIGIGANIGEAVALKKLDGKIDAAEQEMSELDIKIQEKQRQQDLLKPENNTCGVRECGTSKENFLANATGAADAVCVNASWFPTSCKSGYQGIAKTCTSKGETVNYVLHCNVAKAVEKNCPEITQEWLTQNNAKSGQCDKTTGINYITECNQDYTGVPRANGAPGYEKCVSNIPECGNNCSEICDDNCLTTKYSAKQVVCVNGQNKPLSCLSGSPIGAAKQCRSGGSVVTYYDSCPQYVQPLVGCPECDANCLASLHAKLVRCNEQKHENFIVLCEDGYKGAVALPDGGWLQCVKDTSEPKEQQGQSIYEKMVEENKKLEEKISKSDLPEEISLTKQIVNDNKEFLDRTEEMIQASMDDYGNIPAWNLVGNAVKPTPEQKGAGTPAVPTYLPNQFRGTSGNAVGLPVPAKKTEVAPAAPVGPVLPVAPVKAGRDMGGAAIYYRESVKGAVGNPVATVDGVQYKAFSTTALYTQREKSGLDNLRRKLEDAGYSNFNLVKSN